MHLKRGWRIISFPVRVLKVLDPVNAENEVAGYFSRQPKSGRGSNKTILLQTAEDIYYLGIFGAVTQSLRKNEEFQVQQIVFNSLRVGDLKSPRDFLVIKIVSWLVARKWLSLYRTICDGVAYKSTGISHFLTDLIDVPRAYLIWKKLDDKASLLALNIDGVYVGDLIYDSYLRFKPSPTVNIRNLYLWRIIWQAIRDIRSGTRYFAKVKPVMYLTSYSAYIQHGIATRLALQAGVSVYCFGNYQEFAKKLTCQDSFQTVDAGGYKQGFLLLPDQESKIQRAESELLKRFSGEIDPATAYMKKSAYEETITDLPDVAGKIVIFLHDFYDSPHIYPDLVFPDFWEWVNFTIERLEALKIPYLLKPHPNQIDISDHVIDDLRRDHPGIQLVPAQITNKQLVVDGKMACAITMYGTVAHEMAYLGAPTIACAGNPHVSFNFCKTAKSKKEYSRFLENYNNLDFDADDARRESLVFYYMHNLNNPAQISEILNKVSRFRSSCRDDNVVDGELEKILGDIEQMESFQHYVAEMNNSALADR